MLGSRYNESSEEDEDEKGNEEKAEGAEEADEDDEEEEEEDEDDDEVTTGKLPSASSAFGSMSKDSLEFKKFEANVRKQKKVRNQAMSMERVHAASAASLRSAGYEPAAAATPAVPDASAESSSGTKRTIEETESGGGKGKGKDGKGKMNVKDRTKIKRMKGQSGIDHNGTTWKPEAWMTMRQQFD
eukprot:TRINITY_DN12650_c0_g1_i1.p2 TRINITY_DN12650_c0_g1~~TRINITY_DN12650_c0_g1_i1.p2  ORF type:complete len:186 (-),score=72.78 TRINITY_DN12650_c0_g1_i1:56-613(-)